MAKQKAKINREEEEELRRKRTRRTAGFLASQAAAARSGYTNHIPTPPPQVMSAIGRAEPEVQRAFADVNYDIKSIHRSHGNRFVKRALMGQDEARVSELRSGWGVHRMFAERHGQELSEDFLAREQASLAEADQLQRRIEAKAAAGFPAEAHAKAAELRRSAAARRRSWDHFGVTPGASFEAQEAAVLRQADALDAQAAEAKVYLDAQDHDGTVTVHDPQAGLDVTYDAAGGGAPEVNLGQVKEQMGSGHPLDSNTRAYMEWRFQVDFSKVRLHTGPKADALSKALFAHAFALGADVAFQGDSYRPGTKEGDRLLAHELTHVVQAGMAPRVAVDEAASESSSTAMPSSALPAAGSFVPLPSSVTSVTRVGQSLRGLAKSGSVSEPTDAIEIEADRMADEVVSVSRGDFQAALRSLASGDSEQDQGADSEQVSAAELVKRALASRSEALPEVLRERLEQVAGVDLSEVRIYSNELAFEAAEAVSARAFTVGSNIVFGAGEYLPGSPAGDALISHEISHVLEHLGAQPAGAAGATQLKEDPAKKGRKRAGSDSSVHKVAAHGVAGAGGKLPHVDKIQQSFGSHDVSDVKAAVGGKAREASEAIGAEAYASGDKVAFKDSPDLHTAAHEAAHVVQQRSGVSVEGGVGKAGDRYEQHADAVADAVVAGKSAQPLLDSFAGGAAGVQKKAVQRKETGEGEKTEEPTEEEIAQMKAEARAEGQAKPPPPPPEEGTPAKGEETVPEESVVEEGGGDAGAAFESIGMSATQAGPNTGLSSLATEKSGKLSEWDDELAWHKFFKDPSSDPNDLRVDKSALAGEAFLGGVGEGVIDGAWQVGNEQLMKVFAKKIPHLQGFVEMAKVVYDPKAWIENTAQGLLGGGKFQQGAQLMQGDWVDKIEGVVLAMEGVNTIIGTLSSILWIAAAAGFLVSFICPAFIPFVGWAAQGAMTLGKISGLVGIGLTVLKGILALLRAAMIAWGPSDPASLLHQADHLQESTKGFVGDYSANLGNSIADRVGEHYSEPEPPKIAGAPDPYASVEPQGWDVALSLATGDIGGGKGDFGKVIQKKEIDMNQAISDWEEKTWFIGAEGEVGNNEERAQSETWKDRKKAKAKIKQAESDLEKAQKNLETAIADTKMAESQLEETRAKLTEYELNEFDGLSTAEAIALAKAYEGDWGDYSKELSSDGSNKQKKINALVDLSANSKAMAEVDPDGPWSTDTTLYDQQSAALKQQVGRDQTDSNFAQQESNKMGELAVALEGVEAGKVVVQEGQITIQELTLDKAGAEQQLQQIDDQLFEAKFFDAGDRPMENQHSTYELRYKSKPKLGKGLPDGKAKGDPKATGIFDAFEKEGTRLKSLVLSMDDNSFWNGFQKTTRSKEWKDLDLTGPSSQQRGIVKGGTIDEKRDQLETMFDSLRQTLPAPPGDDVTGKIEGGRVVWETLDNEERQVKFQIAAMGEMHLEADQQVSALDVLDQLAAANRDAVAAHTGQLDEKISAQQQMNEQGVKAQTEGGKGETKGNEGQGIAGPFIGKFMEMLSMAPPGLLGGGGGDAQKMGKSMDEQVQASGGGKQAGKETSNQAKEWTGQTLGAKATAAQNDASFAGAQQQALADRLSTQDGIAFIEQATASGQARLEAISSEKEAQRTAHDDAIEQIVGWIGTHKSVREAGLGRLAGKVEIIEKELKS